MRVGLTTSIATAIAIGVLIASGGAPPGTANLWIDQNGGTCTRSSVAISYDGVGDAASCASVADAVSAASASDTVLIRGGDYANQAAINPPNNLTVSVASGQTVTFDKLFLQGTNGLTVNGPLTLDGDYHYGPPFSTQGDWSLEVTQCHTNLTLNNVSGFTFDIGLTVNGFTMNGGTWGNYTDRPYGGDPTLGGLATIPACGGDGIVRNAVFDGVTFTDVQFGPEATWQSGHPDCLQLEGKIDTLTIRNSRFIRCGNDFIGMYLDEGDAMNVVVENNLMVAVADSDAAIQLGYKVGTQCSVVYRYNTYDPNGSTLSTPQAPPVINCEGDGSDGDTFVYGNVFKKAPTGGCDGSWDYNVFESGSCGTHATSGTMGYVDRQTADTPSDNTFDYHLAVGSVAIGAGKPGSAPTDFPTTDFEGTTRTSPPDAGYDQR